MPLKRKPLAGGSYPLEDTMRLIWVLLGVVACSQQVEPRQTARMSLRKIRTQHLVFDRDVRAFDGRYLKASWDGRALLVELILDNPCDWPVAGGIRITGDTADIGIVDKEGDSSAAFREPAPPLVGEVAICTTNGIPVLMTYSGRITLTAEPHLVRLWQGGRITAQSIVTSAAS